MNTELLSKNHISFFFFFNDTATTEIYTLSLHDALPIFHGGGVAWIHFDRVGEPSPRHEIDPVHPHQAERPGDALRQEGGPLEQAAVRRKVGISRRPEDAAAVTEAIASERGLPRENAREPQRYRAAPLRPHHE